MLRTVAVALAAAVYSSQAFAILDVQVYGGTGTGKVELSQPGASSERIGLRGNDLGLAAHLNPIDMLPVSIGIAYLQVAPRIGGAGAEGYESVTGDEVSTEVMAWLPISGYAVYGKFGEVIYGKYELTVRGDDDLAGISFPVTRDLDYHGRYGAVGLGLGVTAGLGLFAEIRGRLGGRLVETAGHLERSGLVDSRARTVGDIQSTSILAGLELGI
jgi:hypothetical protein